MNRTPLCIIIICDFINRVFHRYPLQIYNVIIRYKSRVAASFFVLALIFIFLQLYFFFHMQSTLQLLKNQHPAFRQRCAQGSCAISTAPRVIKWWTDAPYVPASLTSNGWDNAATSIKTVLKKEIKHIHCFPSLKK